MHGKSRNYQGPQELKKWGKKGLKRYGKLSSSLTKYVEDKKPDAIL